MGGYYAWSIHIERERNKMSDVIEVIIDNVMI